MYLPVPGFEPTSSEFLDKCVIRQATVALAVGLTVSLENLDELANRLSANYHRELLKKKQ